MSESNRLGGQERLEIEMEVIHFVKEEDEGRLKNKEEKDSDNNFHPTQFSLNPKTQPDPKTISLNLNFQKTNPTHIHPKLALNPT